MYVAVFYFAFNRRPPILIQEERTDMKTKILIALTMALTLTSLSFAAQPSEEPPPNTYQVIVAKEGGDFADPIAAMDSILDASAATPYLIKILPGIYDVGANPLYVKDYVSIEGSGIETTTIKGSVTSNSGLTVGLIVAGNNSRVSNLYIENNENTYNSLAVSCSNVQNFTLQNISIVSNGLFGSYGVDIRGNSDAYIKDIKITAEEGIRVNQEAKLIARNISVIIDDNTSTSSSYGGVGLLNFRGDVFVDGFSIDGTLDPDKVQRGILVQHVLQNAVYGSTKLNNGIINVNNGNASSNGIDASGVDVNLIELTNTNIISSGSAITGSGKISNCYLEGLQSSIPDLSPGYFISNTKIIGPLAGYNAKCFNNYDGDLNPIVCQ